MEKAGAELASIREIAPEEAEELVYHYIHQVIDAFRIWMKSWQKSIVKIRNIRGQLSIVPSFI